MKKTIAIFLLIFGSLSCSEEQFMFTQEIAADIVTFEPFEPTSLILENQLEDNFYITSWSMVGYEFKDLGIQPGDSDQFIMVNGMTEGYKDLNVTVVFSSSTGSFSISDKVNFTPGGVTKITVSGCEACGGYQIASSW